VLKLIDIMCQFTMRKVARRGGFSLVELLVVIAIIGILISLIYVNFLEARKNTRDKLRQTTLADIQLAIERYKAQTSSYPQAGCGATGVQWVTPGVGTAALPGVVNCSNFIPGLVPEYLPELPDPIGPAGVGYYYKSDGNSYKVVVYNAVETTAQQVTSFSNRFAVCPAQCGSSGGLCGSTPNPISYAVYSPGGSCF
jgi:prepilin-type N-terminal cleavage/methylation domain-containing protein